jgi:hypothetical protein
MEEFTCVPEGEAERFLGVPHRFQAPGQAIEELEELEFPLLNIHDCLEKRGLGQLRSVPRGHVTGSSQRPRSEKHAIVPHSS